MKNEMLDLTHQGVRRSQQGWAPLRSTKARPGVRTGNPSRPTEASWLGNKAPQEHRGQGLSGLP